MKKLISFFFIFIFGLLFTSCSKNNDKFMLEGSLDNTTTTKIDLSDLKDKIENEDDFVLTISLDTCSSCISFNQDVLNKYIEKTHATIYSIDLIEIVGTEKFDQKPSTKEAPAVIIYQKGKKVNTQKHTDSNKIFKELDEFENYLNKYTYSPKLVEISEEKLDTKIINQDDFMLYIGWNLCSDCKLLENRVLDEYLKNLDDDKIVYYLESDKYRKNKPMTKPGDDASDIEKQNWENWINFATKYNFVSYRDGKVPTMQYYDDGKVKEMIVYHNDVIENGIVTISFFNELIGTNKDDNSLINYHDQKLKEFLDKYLK